MNGQYGYIVSGEMCQVNNLEDRGGNFCKNVKPNKNRLGLIARYTV
jgi:hypothetical protein